MNQTAWFNINTYEWIFYPIFQSVGRINLLLQKCEGYGWPEYNMSDFSIEVQRRSRKGFRAGGEGSRGFKDEQYRQLWVSSRRKKKMDCLHNWMTIFKTIYLFNQIIVLELLLSLAVTYSSVVLQALVHTHKVPLGLASHWGGGAKCCTARVGASSASRASSHMDSLCWVRLVLSTAADATGALLERCRNRIWAA